MFRDYSFEIGLLCGDGLDTLGMNCTHEHTVHMYTCTHCTHANTVHSVHNIHSVHNVHTDHDVHTVMFS